MTSKPPFPSQVYGAVENARTAYLLHEAAHAAAATTSDRDLHARALEAWAADRGPGTARVGAAAA